MTLVSTRAIIIGATIGFGAIGAFSVGCDDIEPTPGPTPDSGTTTDAEPDGGVSPPDPSEAGPTPPSYSANIGFFNAKSQPNDLGIPEILVPSSLVQIRSTNPERAPDLVIDGPFAPLGCMVYKFPTVDPTKPNGPRFNEGDLGKITLEGFTGGTGPGGDIPKPLTCERNEFPPSTGLFTYTCGFPQGPTSGFLATTDDLTVTFAGGKDSPGFNVKSLKSSPIDNLKVKNNLWALPASALDGTSDLQIEYDCGSEACAEATLVAVMIDTTDGEAPEDAGTGTPFDFYPPTNEFASLLCIDLFPKHTTGYTIPKSALALIPQSWKAARVLVATVSAGQGVSPSGVPTSIFAGDGILGITHR